MSIPLLFAKRRFTPRRLFAAGELGSVHIARDLNTLISTAAGSTPDVSLNGYAGKWLDQSGLGNHATQATSGFRPQLSARLNLIPSFTEQFEQTSVWARTTLGTGATPIVTANAGTDPLGGSTADRIQMSRTGTGTGDRSMMTRTLTGVAALSTSHTYKVWLKSYDGTNQTIMLYANWGAGVGSVITVTGAWQQFSVAANTTSSSNVTVNFGLGMTAMSATAADILAWGIDLRRTADFDVYPAYQRVVSATDYDTTGFPQFLSFDSDDALVATYPSSLGSACTVCIGRAATTPLILTGQTIDTTYTLNAAIAPRVTGLIVVNRALTAIETAQVTAYLQARS